MNFDFGCFFITKSVNSLANDNYFSVKTILQVTLLNIYEHKCINVHSNCIINALICALIISISIQSLTITSNRTLTGVHCSALYCVGTVRFNLLNLAHNSHFSNIHPPHRNICQGIWQCIPFSPLEGSPLFHVFFHIGPPYGGQDDTKFSAVFPHMEAPFPYLFQLYSPQQRFSM